jgi:hypothetical protein
LQRFRQHYFSRVLAMGNSESRCGATPVQPGAHLQEECGKRTYARKARDIQGIA